MSIIDKYVIDKYKTSKYKVFNKFKKELPILIFR